MASSKLSALTALTSVGADDLVYVADTADGGSSYSSKKVTKSNLFSGYATESYVDTAVSNLIDGAPDALNTLNELAAALNDDASASASLTTLINANETHIDNVATLSGVAKDSTDLGTFTGTTIADDVTVKAALQSLETAVETKCDTGANVNTLVGVTSGETEPASYLFLVVSRSEILRRHLIHDCHELNILKQFRSQTWR